MNGLQNEHLTAKCAVGRETSVNQFFRRCVLHKSGKILKELSLKYKPQKRENTIKFY